MKLLLLLFFFLSNVYALDLCALRLAAISRDYTLLKSFREKVAQSIANSTHPIPMIDETSIEKVEDLGIREKEMGKLNKGVFRVYIKDKPYIMKLRVEYAPDDIRKIIESGNQLNQLLGEMGIAPRLLGIVSSPDIHALGMRIPIISHSLEVNGLVMEEIKEAWNPKNTLVDGKAPPAWVYKMDFKSIQFQLAEILKAVIALGIYPKDLQVFISKEGKVFLGDLDLYKLESEPDSQTYLAKVTFFFDRLADNIKSITNR